MAEMSPEQVQAFLDRTGPAPLGSVATLRPDGSPHLIPVWYRFDGQVVHIWTDEERVWVKNLRRDGRVAFSVQEERPPYAAVIMRGRAQVVTGDGDVMTEIRRITGRYVAEPDVDAYVQGWAHLSAIVMITPSRIISWDRGY